MILSTGALALWVTVGVQPGITLRERPVTVTVALAAAQEGVRTAAGLGGSRAAGARDAYAFVADAGGDDVLTGVVATGARTVTTATVTVRGRSLSVIPGWSPLLEQSATAPVERLT